MKYYYLFWTDKNDKNTLECIISEIIDERTGKVKTTVQRILPKSSESEYLHLLVTQDIHPVMYEDTIKIEIPEELLHLYINKEE